MSAKQSNALDKPKWEPVNQLERRIKANIHRVWENVSIGAFALSARYQFRLCRFRPG